MVCASAGKFARLLLQRVRWKQIARNRKNLRKKGETMLSKKFIQPAASIGLAAVILLPPQSLRAETSSEADRLAKLERAVEQLQQRNADLERKVSTLRKQPASSPPAPTKHPTKKHLPYQHN